MQKICQKISYVSYLFLLHSLILVCIHLLCLGKKSFIHIKDILVYQKPFPRQQKRNISPRHLNNLCERIKNVVFNFDQSIYFSVTPTCKINMIYRTNLKQICEESLGGHLPAAPTLNLPAGLLLPLF